MSRLNGCPGKPCYDFTWFSICLDPATSQSRAQCLHQQHDLSTTLVFRIDISCWHFSPSSWSRDKNRVDIHWSDDVADDNNEMQRKKEWWGRRQDKIDKQMVKCVFLFLKDRNRKKQKETQEETKEWTMDRNERNKFLRCVFSHTSFLYSRLKWRRRKVMKAWGVRSRFKIKITIIIKKCLLTFWFPPTRT